MSLLNTAHTDEITALPALDDPQHPLNQISEKIRDSIFDIHRTFGPGLLESAYEDYLEYDLIENQKLKVERQKILPLQFKGLHVKNAYKVDLLVEDQIIVELKACEKILPIHRAQLLTYMKIHQSRLGYLVNFNTKLIKDGISRFVL
ncbi:MAG: GxxExxY protein [Bdellovibrionales bacterium]